MLRMYSTKVEFLSFFYAALILPISKRSMEEVFCGGVRSGLMVQSGLIKAKGLTCPQVS